MRDALHEASTRNGTSRRRIWLQGTLCARLSSWARCIARNSATRASTRTAPRSSRLARQTSGQPPVTVTPPRTGRLLEALFPRLRHQRGFEARSRHQENLEIALAHAACISRRSADIDKFLPACLTLRPPRLVSQSRTIVECHHRVPGPLPLRTRPLFVPQPGDHHRRTLRLLALRPARRRPVVALHPGRGFHAARRSPGPRKLSVEREGLEQLFLQDLRIFTYIADGENGKDGYRVNLGCVEGIEPLALEISIIDGKSVPLVDAPH